MPWEFAHLAKTLPIELQPPLRRFERGMDAVFPQSSLIATVGRQSSSPLIGVKSGKTPGDGHGTALTDVKGLAARSIYE